LHWQKVGSEPAIHYLFICLFTYFWVILAIEHLKWQTTQKINKYSINGNNELLENSLKTAEKTSLKNPWENKTV
jgi:hypothetical protein